MGQKIPAKANRLGVWVRREKDAEPRLAAEYSSSWFEEFNDFADSLEKDWKIREAIAKKYGKKAGISEIIIARKDKKVEINIRSIRPATVLGKDNQKVDELKGHIKDLIQENVKVNVIEASSTDPQIIAEKIAYDLERRIAFRRAAKTAISKAMASPDVIGIKIIISGRLGGAEIARTEWYLEGKVPLHTWYANVKNGFAEAETTYGIIGVKVIINRQISSPGKQPVPSKGAKTK
ncbi:MAG: 30S ribosomal protein S3 [Candidatus Caenarcaniphilales bacterium]|nr:30S ribosomal protein S3 [Candidatus Caenarcaniphilales bacterium]